MFTCAVRSVNRKPIRGDRRLCQANQHDRLSRIMYWWALNKKRSQMLSLFTSNKSHGIEWLILITVLIMFAFYNERTFATAPSGSAKNHINMTLLFIIKIIFTQCDTSSIKSADVPIISSTRNILFQKDITAKRTWSSLLQGECWAASYRRRCASMWQIQHRSVIASVYRQQHLQGRCF